MKCISAQSGKWVVAKGSLTAGPLFRWLKRQGYQKQVHMTMP
eukprot:CAMPEP_0206136986 /NCGR_PEP_ID=MMETSP1473-20131121/2178_1 /ASSEMBLY_ACC=CAM_ASM_001109 /TAXON_ID=1461547 /ORGANISM="Stichococcus sp, Strain RCC1054" /LENGTH=41 /DNA_ID= /DNA_START= /DNA_END= /DNA_ORIENTATION=